MDGAEEEVAGAEFGGEKDGESEPRVDEGEGDGEAEGEEAGAGDSFQGAEAKFSGVLVRGPLGVTSGKEGFEIE